METIIQVHHYCYKNIQTACPADLFLYTKTNHMSAFRSKCIYTYMYIYVYIFYLPNYIINCKYCSCYL